MVLAFVHMLFVQMFIFVLMRNSDMCLIDQKFGGLHQRTWRICVSYRIPRERNPFPHPHDLFQVKLKFSSIGLPGGDGLKGIMAQNKMQSIDFKMQNKGRNGQLGLDLS